MQRQYTREEKYKIIENYIGQVQEITKNCQLYFFLTQQVNIEKVNNWDKLIEFVETELTKLKEENKKNSQTASLLERLKIVTISDNFSIPSKNVDKCISNEVSDSDDSKPINFNNVNSQKEYSTSESIELDELGEHSIFPDQVFDQSKSSPPSPRKSI
jgi:hypothetical protein